MHAHIKSGPNGQDYRPLGRVSSRVAVPFAAALALLSIALPASAADVSREVALTSFKVCADPHNLPFSNREQQGYENKIAKLIADDLGLPLEYVWAPQSMGFVRSTLNTHVCDVIIGMVMGDELVQNTNAYYRSTYALVYRKDAQLPAKTLSDPSLKGHSIGIIAGTPPADELAKAGFAGQLRPYRLFVDTRYNAPGQDLINDLTEGRIDVVALWGPIAGYFAKHSTTPIVVVPLVDEPDPLHIEYRMAMGVRRNEPKLKHLLNGEIKKLKPQIDAILADYGVPTLDEAGQVNPTPN